MIDRATIDAHKLVSSCISLHLVYHLWGMRVIVTPELKSEIEVAGISLDSALAYAERIAAHGVLHSNGGRPGSARSRQGADGAEGSKRSPRRRLLASGRQ
jgi:hypothetical protein